MLHRPVELASYNSNIWSYVYSVYNNVPNGLWTTVNAPPGNHIGANGWTLLDGPSVGWQNSQLDCDGAGCTTDIYCSRFYSAVMPDGGAVSFPNARTNCYQVLANGTHQAAPEYNVNQDEDIGTGATIDLQAGIVRTIDGSKITFQANSAVGPLEDRNGNLRASPISYGIGDSGTISNTDDTGAQVITMTYAPAPKGTEPLSFPCNADTITSISIPTGVGGNVLQALTLQNGTKYTFEYDDYGEITKITYPTGGYTRYSWQTVCQPTTSYDGWTADRFITAKFVCSSASGCSSSQEQETDYGWSWSNATVSGVTTINSSVVTITENPNSTSPRITSVTFDGDATLPNVMMSGAFGVNWHKKVMSGGATLETVDDTHSQLSLGVDQEQKITTLANGSSSQIVTTYGDPVALTFNPSEIVESDNGSVLRDTKISYWPNSFNLRSQPTQVQVYNGSNVLMSQVNYGIDESTYPLQDEPSAANHDSSYGTGYTARGNVTSVTQWLNNGTSPVTHTQYDILGNVVNRYDALNSNKTSYSYNDNFGSATACAPAGQYGYAYPTSIVNPLGQQTKQSFYSCSGLIQSQQNANDITAGRAGTVYYYDAMRNLTETDYPDGGSTTISHNGYGIPLTIATTTIASPDPAVVMSDVHDGIGRVVSHVVQPGTTEATTTDTTYDSFNRISSVSNPHTGSPSPTDGTTYYQYNALDQKTLEIEADGIGQLHWSYTGNCTTFTDEVSHAWTRCGDALGRLTSVVEPIGATTNYIYDALGNLLTVNQLGVFGETPRTRSFSYDSLSRLTQAYNPETGWMCYGTTPSGAAPNGSNCTPSYDANGNLLAKTNGNGVTLYYTYDTLNRVLSETAPSSVNSWVENGWTYDQAFGNGIGRVTTGGNWWSGTQYIYDAMGRIIATNDTTSYVPWSPGFAASYDLAGKMRSLTYPDGRIVTQTWDGAGHLSSVSSPATSQFPAVTYAQFAYSAAGSEQGFTLGGNINQNNSFNSRLQTCFTEVGLLSPDKGGAPMFLAKEYWHAQTPGDDPCGTASGNNGNIWSIADLMNPGLSQTFNFDSLNRLTSAASADNSYNQTYTYDSFGNLIPQNVGSTPLNYSVNSQTNQLQRNVSDFQYDGAGNLNAIAGPLGTTEYSPNAKGQIFQVNWGNTATYRYYADDARAIKVTPSGWTSYEHFDGLDAAEVTSDGTWTDHIFANGRRIASVSNSDIRVHLSGSNPTAGDSNRWVAGVLAGPANYVIKASDQLAFRMYVRNANAAVSFSFSDGSNTDGSCISDQNGDCLTSESTSGKWVNRIFPNFGVSANGKTITSLFVENNQGSPAGQFDVMVADMTITTSDGTVTQLVGETATGTCSTGGTPGNTTNLTCVSEKVNSASDFAGPPQTTRYYIGDQVGTAQLEFTDGGWPLWKGEFTPFGQEVDSQTTANPYKFTGKERDTESGLDYFGARYMSSTMGRWTSPDPSALFYSDPGDPQTLNLYAYVGNHPLQYVDPYGLSWFTQAPCSGTQYAGLSLVGEVKNFFANLFADCGGGGGGNSTDDDSNNRFGGGMGSGNASAMSHQQINQLITTAQKSFSKKCDSAYRKAIPGYNKQSFFNSLYNAPVNQFPNSSAPTDPQASATTGSGASGPETKRPINLWHDFYTNETSEAQPFVLVHEQTHRYTGWGDVDQSGHGNDFVNHFRPFGYTYKQYGGGTGQFTDWLQGGCPAS